jgi:hypothetical protein
MKSPGHRAFEAAIAAYKSTERERFVLPPPEAARLLAVMFRGGNVCRRSVADLAW